MTRRLFDVVLFSIALTLTPWEGIITAQEPVDAQDLITVLKDLIAKTSEETKDSLGRITSVEIQIGVLYIKDKEGKLKILAVPHDGSVASATVHKLTLHWIPQARGQGNMSFPGAMGVPTPSQLFSPGFTPEQQEKMKELMLEKHQRRSEEKRGRKTAGRKNTPLKSLFLTRPQ